MKALITFNKEESDDRTSSGWNWFYGTVLTLEDDKEYEFSLCEMNTNVGGQNTTAVEITWVGETPEDSTELESLIEIEFEIDYPQS